MGRKEEDGEGNVGETPRAGGRTGGKAERGGGWESLFTLFDASVELPVSETFCSITFRSTNLYKNNSFPLLPSPPLVSPAPSLPSSSSSSCSLLTFCSRSSSHEIWSNESRQDFSQINHLRPQHLQLRLHEFRRFGLVLPCLITNVDVDDDDDVVVVVVDDDDDVVVVVVDDDDDDDDGDDDDDDGDDDDGDDDGDDDDDDETTTMMNEEEEEKDEDTIFVSYPQPRNLFMQLLFRQSLFFQQRSCLVQLQKLVTGSSQPHHWKFNTRPNKCYNLIIDTTLFTNTSTILFHPFMTTTINSQQHKHQQ